MENCPIMVESDLEHKIRKVIEDTYECITTFKIKAKIVDGTYIVFLYLHNDRIDPLQILWEGDDEDKFLEFLQIDLKKRNLIRSTHYKIDIVHDFEV